MSNSLFLVFAVLLAFTCASDTAEHKWKPYRGNLYLFLKEQHSFFNAEARCVELGAHVVSIHSTDENNFVHRLREKKAVWIGKHKIGQNITGIHKWSDGTPHDDYAPPWDLCQPNEPWTDCLFMAYRSNNLGRWSDYFCEGKLPFYYIPGPPYVVCKKKQPKTDF